MDQNDHNETPGGAELRCFARISFPAFNRMSVELGPLGRRPAEGVPLNISRGGLQTRTGATMFQGSVGDEILIRFDDPAGRLVPDRALGWVRRVEESRGYFLISIEFSHPLERIDL